MCVGTRLKHVLARVCVRAFVAYMLVRVICLSVYAATRWKHLRYEIVHLNKSSGAHVSSQSLFLCRVQPRILKQRNNTPTTSQFQNGVEGHTNIITIIIIIIIIMKNFNRRSCLCSKRRELAQDAHSQWIARINSLHTLTSTQLQPLCAKRQLSYYIIWTQKLR